MEIESDPKKRGAGKTVLVVDDSVVIRKLLAAAFLSDGFRHALRQKTAKKLLR